MGACGNDGLITAVKMPVIAAARSWSVLNANSLNRSDNSARACSACCFVGLSGTLNWRALNAPNMPVIASYPAFIIRLPSGLNKVAGLCH